MAVTSNLKNMALCLSGVCLVCSAILGGVYALTKEPIAAAEQKKTEKGIALVLPEGGELSQKAEAELEGATYEYYALSENGSVKAYAVKSSATGFGGALELMVGVLSDGTVYNTSVLKHSETPGLGAKCKTDEKFIGQFHKLPASAKIAVKKDGGELDAITGSTITSRAYALAVKNAVELVKTLGEK